MQSKVYLAHINHILSFLGDGLLGDAHLVLDVVDGVGEYPSGLTLHIIELPVSGPTSTVM